MCNFSFAQNIHLGKYNFLLRNSYCMQCIKLLSYTLGIYKDKLSRYLISQQNIDHQSNRNSVDFTFQKYIQCNYRQHHNTYYIMTGIPCNLIIAHYHNIHLGMSNFYLFLIVLVQKPHTLYKLKDFFHISRNDESMAHRSLPNRLSHIHLCTCINLKELLSYCCIQYN